MKSSRPQCFLLGSDKKIPTKPEYFALLYSMRNGMIVPGSNLDPNNMAKNPLDEKGCVSSFKYAVGSNITYDLRLFKLGLPSAKGYDKRIKLEGDQSLSDKETSSSAVYVFPEEN